jgi:hypothetical protein
VGQAFAGSGGGMAGTGRCAGPLCVTSMRAIPPVPLARTWVADHSAAGACAAAAGGWTAGTAGRVLAGAPGCGGVGGAGTTGTGAKDGVACAGIVASTGAAAGRSGAIPRAAG